MCYTLFVVGERVCEIIHGIYAPLVAGLMMRNVRNAVNNGVAHIYVRRRHIDFARKTLAPFGNSPFVIRLKRSRFSSVVLSR